MGYIYHIFRPINIRSLVSLLPSFRQSPVTNICLLASEFFKEKIAAAKSAIGAGKNDISGLEPVKPADPHVIEIGQFAVAKHNEEPGIELFFVAVVGGFTWSIIGGNYYALIIETQDGIGATYLHKALVFEIPDEGLKLIWYKN